MKVMTANKLANDKHREMYLGSPVCGKCSLSRVPDGMAKSTHFRRSFQVQNRRVDPVILSNTYTRETTCPRHRHVLDVRGHSSVT